MDSTETYTLRMAFRTSLFGFDKLEVRALLSDILGEHEEALAQIDSLRRELNRVQAAPTPNPTPQPNATGHMVERVLTSAHQVADVIRKEAEQESARLMTEAKGRAALLIDETEIEVAKKSEAALNRLKEIEREIERMLARHRHVRVALEAMVTAVGATLADIGGFDGTADEPADHLNAFESEDEEKVARAAR